jgi:hypothetical protein
MNEKYKKRIDDYISSSNKFWSEEYPLKSFEEKIDFWASNIHRQMRWNSESGFDEMDVFSKADYENWKLKDPDFDKLIYYVIKKLNLNADKVYNAMLE